jgi:hypothetical protein
MNTFKDIQESLNTILRYVLPGGVFVLSWGYLWPPYFWFLKVSGSDNEISLPLGATLVIVSGMVIYLLNRGLLFPICRCRVMDAIIKSGSSTFFVGSFTDLPAFVAKLSQRNGAVSQFLIDKFSPETREKLKKQEETKPLSKALQTLIVKELNAVITSALIYDRDLFKGIEFRKETQELLGANPKGQELIQLNRMLLEVAYPQEISKSLKSDSRLKNYDTPDKLENALTERRVWRGKESPWSVHFSKWADEVHALYCVSFAVFFVCIVYIILLIWRYSLSHMVQGIDWKVGLLFLFGVITLFAAYKHHYRLVTAEVEDLGLGVSHPLVLKRK